MYSITIDFPDSGIRKFTYSQDNGLIEITEIRRCINNYFFENQVVTISLNNQTGYWYRLFEGEDQYLIGQTVKVYDNKMHIGTFTISDITPGTIFKIKADLFSVLSGSISRELTAGEFPEIHFENIGKKGCFIFGVLDDADWLNIGQCWAYQIAPGKFLAAFHHLKNVLSVFDTKDNAIAFTWENEGDYSYIYTDFQGPEVFFNCEGCCDQQGALIQNPAKILEAMQEMSGGPAIDGLTAAEAIYINKAYLENAIIIQDETWQQFLELFCYNYDTFCYQGIPGAVKMAVQDFENAAKTKTINHSYIKDYSPDLLLDECVKAVKRRYYYHYRQKKYRFQPQVQTATKWKPDSIAMLDLAFHRGEVGSFERAVQHLFYRETPPIQVDFKIPKSEGRTLELNSFIELTNNEGFYVNQARIYHVIGIEFLDAAVDLSLIDITKYKREALTLAGFTLDFTARL